MAENLEFIFVTMKNLPSQNGRSISSKQKSITVLQIETNLQSLFKLKIDGYDICAMINDTISAGYKRLLKPTPIYLLQNRLVNLLLPISNAHTATTTQNILFLENKSEKCELRNYLERCYMRGLVDPRTNYRSQMNKKAVQSTF